MQKAVKLLTSSDLWIAEYSLHFGLLVVRAAGIFETTDPRVTNDDIAIDNNFSTSPEGKSVDSLKQIVGYQNGDYNEDNSSPGNRSYSWKG